MAEKPLLWRYVIAALIVITVVVLVLVQGYNKWWGPQPHTCERYDGLCVHTTCEVGMTSFEKGVCYNLRGELETLEVCCQR